MAFHPPSQVYSYYLPIYKGAQCSVLTESRWNVAHEHNMKVKTLKYVPVYALSCNKSETLTMNSWGKAMNSWESSAIIFIIMKSTDKNDINSILPPSVL